MSTGGFGQRDVSPCIYVGSVSVSSGTEINDLASSACLGNKKSDMTKLVNYNIS